MSTSSIVEELVADASPFMDGSVDDLIALLDALAALGGADSPTPSPELASLLAGRPPVRRDVRPARPVRRARHVVGGLAAAAVAALSVTGAAAVANELPASMQSAVARFSESYLPFSFPRPVGDPARDGTPTSVPTAPQRTASAPPLRSAASPATDKQHRVRTSGRSTVRDRPEADPLDRRATPTRRGVGSSISAPRGSGQDGVVAEPVDAPAPPDGTADKPGKGPRSDQGGKPAAPPGQGELARPAKGPTSAPAPGAGTGKGQGGTTSSVHAPTGKGTGPAGTGSGATE